MKHCTICGDKLYSKDFCNKHYQRWRKHGDPLIVRGRSKSGSPGVNQVPESQFVEIVEESTSYAECLRKLQLKAAGGSYKVLQERISRLNLDTSHFLGQAHGKSSNRLRAEEVLKLGTKNRNGVVRRILFEELKWSKTCSVCGVEDQWQGRPMTLELDHINGINTDNRAENLRFLCPNCHSQTDTFSVGVSSMDD